MTKSNLRCTRHIKFWLSFQITIDNPATKQQYLFECNRWLGRSEDDGELIRELPALGGKGDSLPGRLKLFRLLNTVLVISKPASLET